MTEPGTDGRAGKQYSVAEVVGDIADLARIARKIAAKGRSAYDSGGEGEILRKAARQVVTDLATAVSRLDENVKDSHPEVPWRDIQDTRNYIAHAYDHVNDDIIWAAIDGEIADVESALAEYLPADVTEGPDS